MEFHLSLSPEHLPGADPVAALRGHVRQARAARAADFAGLLAGQHVSTSGMQWFPPFQLLSHLAPACEGMSLGTAVAILPFSHPVLLAEAAATLDAISAGKSVLGLAGGWNRTEFASLGVSRAGGARRVREGIEVIKRLWSEDGVTHHGEFYRLEDVTLALRPAGPRPPIWIGASSRQAVTVLADVCDALVYSSHLSVDDLTALQQIFLDAREQAGVAAPEQTPVLRNVFVGADRESAVRACMPYVAASYEHYENSGLFRDVIAHAGADPNAVADALGERLVVGSAQEVAAELRRVVDALGVTKMVVRMQWLGMPSELVEDSITRFGADVIPQLTTHHTDRDEVLR